MRAKLTSPFQIAPHSMQIPTVWKTSWDHLTPGRSIDPEVKFESLLCLTLGPDFVLDFGWCLRDNGLGEEGIRFDLQINRGHFGLSDVVFYESWFHYEPAIFALQNWLDRLAAPPGAQALDSDLQHRFATIEARLRHYFVPPAGEQIEEPLENYLRRLIKTEPPPFWLAGSGDAAIHYRNRHGEVHAQLIFLYREPYGFHIEWHPATGVALRLTNPKRARSDQIVSITLGGAPWDLPSCEFVSRNLAARVICDFVAAGTGDCPGVGTWIS